VLSKLTVSLFESLESRTLFAQTPFSGSPIPVPGMIEAENFDKGGEGVAYHDTTSAQLGGAYRKTEAVDVQTGGNHGFNVGFIKATEWLEYTINVKTAGTYQIDSRLSSGSSGGKFHIDIDGSNKSGTLTLGNTGGWNTFKTITKTGVGLAGGTHVLRINFDSATRSGQDIGNFDYLNLKLSSSSSSGSKFTPKSLSWKSVATNPLAREEAQSLVYNGKLYELGGYFNDFTASLRVDAYDPKTNKWTRKHDLPYAITHAAVAPDPDGHSFWFIVGFKGSFKHNPARGPDGTSDVYKYDAATDTWSKKTSLPEAHGAGGAGIINNKLYFFGGGDKTRSFDRRETYVLDLAHQSNGWKRLADLPNPRNHLGGIVAGGKLYAIGGQHHLEDESVMQTEVDRYDPATNKWTKVASLPHGLSHFNAATVLFDRYIITVGGEEPHNTPRKYVFAYDTVMNKWARLTDLPNSRRAGVAGLVGTKLIQSTGFNLDHQETGTTYIADLANVFA
jgi:N-acetylneuraminic acid mutarotase